MHGCRRWFILLALSLVGCHEPIALPPCPTPAVLAERFDEPSTGTIRGRVTWAGDLPTVAPLKVYANLLSTASHRKTEDRANPNAPKIHSVNRGVGRAVVFLRDVDLERSRPWDHAPARVEFRDADIHVRQGQAEGAIGFIRRATSIECLSRDKEFRALRGRGAAFFTLPFVDPEIATLRRFDQAGIVELSSGAGHYWMRAYLFVTDHPYFALTDDEGRFEFAHVPEGRYQITAWLPNWEIVARERDPESALVSRATFAPPFELEQTVAVVRSQIAAVVFVMPNR